MARANLAILNREEIERIHATSIRVLEEIGVATHSASVNRLLQDHGCSLSKDGKRVLVPEGVVKSAISGAPKSSVLLAGRDKENDIRIPTTERAFMANGGEGVYVKNLVTGKSHTSTLADVKDFAVLAERLPQVDFAWIMVGARDQPPHIKELAELKAGFECTGKHIMAGALTAKQAIDMIEMASVVSGGRDELEKRPIISAVQCPIPPLSFDKGLVEAQVELARAMVPVVAMSAPIAGLSSPVTLSGTVAQVTAENLASLVIMQAARKGSPFVYSSDSSPADMRTGSIDYGGLESPLMHAACGQMGRHFGLPTMVSGASVEEASLCLGSAQEGITFLLAEALTPSDLGSGFGGIDNALGASLEQFVVDAWIWDLAREYARTFDADDAAIAFETIRDVSGGGSYLTQQHTIRRFKKEIVSAGRPEMGPGERDKIGSRGSLIKSARKEAERILREPRKSLLSHGESEELDVLLRKFKAHAKG